jgi:putative hydrolase of the HAD superfamily
VENIRSLFWDVGGVLLTNAWDHQERDRAIERFGLDREDFEARHQPALVAFEEGRLSLDGYLEQTVFYRPRPFAKEDFRSFMFSLSQPKAEALELARQLSRQYRMATLNNESRELNQFRIRKFGLIEDFHIFVSSCFVGVRKPDARIFQFALDLTQTRPEQSLFMDDRPLNIEAAQRLGLQTVLVESPAQLNRALKQQGLKF